MKYTAILLTLFLTPPLTAQNGTESNMEGTTTETQYPRSEGDGSWIAISGEVVSVGHDQFTLNFGEGTIPVRLETDDADEDAHKFIDGEKVRVYGIVDERFLRGTAILARAVFVESMSSYVYATDGTQEFIRVSTPGIASGTVVQGTVTQMNDGQIMLDKGDKMITVDTSTLVEATGEEKPVEGIEVGDRIAVVGNMGREFFTARTLRATSIMPLEGNAGEMHGSDREY